MKKVIILLVVLLAMPGFAVCSPYGASPFIVHRLTDPSHYSNGMTYSILPVEVRLTHGIVPSTVGSTGKKVNDGTQIKTGYSQVLKDTMSMMTEFFAKNDDAYPWGSEFIYLINTQLDEATRFFDHPYAERIDADITEALQYVYSRIENGEWYGGYVRDRDPDTYVEIGYGFIHPDDSSDAMLTCRIEAPPILHP